MNFTGDDSLNYKLKHFFFKYINETNDTIFSDIVKDSTISLFIWESIYLDFTCCPARKSLSVRNMQIK